MSNSQRPKGAPALPGFDVPDLHVPDLELDPAPRSFRQAASGIESRQSGATKERANAAPASFEDDPFETNTLSLDLDAVPRQNEAMFGSLLSFDDAHSLELEHSTAPTLETERQVDDAPKLAHLGRPASDLGWPTGRAPDVTQLKLDPSEIAILADYGDVPMAVQLTPAYAYRVFTRQRELKRQLASIAAECEHAHLEREATLAELGRATRPAAEKLAQFQRQFATLVELEQIATERGRALSSINQQLSVQHGQLESELARISEQLSEQHQLEQEAERLYAERDASAQRADAKLKRLHIEIRALTQVAEQKLGPEGGEVPEPEASKISALRERVADNEAEAERASVELERAKVELEGARARTNALRQSERLSARKKQALAEQYRDELRVRSQGLSENEAQQRAALADLGRAVLAASGAVEVTSAWIERVRRANERADQLLVRREMQVRAIDSFDSARVRQGVQLVCTALGLFTLLILFKLIF